MRGYPFLGAPTVITLSLCPQKGDIILKINDVSLLGKPHSEAIQLIRSVMTASTIRIELIQGDQAELSPDWVKWVEKYEAQSRHQRWAVIRVGNS